MLLPRALSARVAGTAHRSRHGLGRIDLGFRVYLGVSIWGTHLVIGMFRDS